MENMQQAIPSPILKKSSADEDLNLQNTYITSATADVGSVQGEPTLPTKSDKGTEEGFCCVMSMHDGVVL